MVALEPSRVEVEVIAEPAGLAPLLDSWRELAVERGNAFVTPEWFECWRRHYGEGQELRVGAAHAPGGLVGVIPLVVDPAHRPRAARFAGSGLGDYFHPAASAADETAVAAAVAVALQGGRGSRVGIVLENVDADAGWWAEFAKHSGGAPITSREVVLPFARLAGATWEEYLAGRSRNLRSQVGRKLRALEREHEIRVRWCDREDQVAADIATLFRLHSARWTARPGQSALEGERIQAFHTDFARAAHRRRWLRLAFLEADGAAVAGWYGWRLGDRFVYYQAGFDPDWAERSVGFVLMTQTIKAAAEEGAAEYDMLLGDEPFKLRFADESRRACTVVAAPAWSAARALARGEAGLRRAAERLPEGVREPLKRAARASTSRLPMSRRR